MRRPVLRPSTPMTHNVASVWLRVVDDESHRATKLVYAPTPTSTPTAGAPFIVNVAEVDQFGNSITTDNTTAVTLSASNGASNGGFNCGASLTTVVTAGVATFNCTYTNASTTAYTLTAASPGLTSATATMTVGAGAASQIVVWGGNNQSATISTAFANPLSALVTDANGNPVSGATVTFVNPGGNPTGKFRATTNGGACLATGETS